MPADESAGKSIEKTVDCAVMAFAFGGHCQALLVMDYVLAEKSAFLRCRRRKASFRGPPTSLAAFYPGPRIARQAINTRSGSNATARGSSLLRRDLRDRRDGRSVRRVVTG